MTEKRFNVSEYTDKIHDKLREEEYYFEDKVDWYKICGLLNALHEENQQLKKEKDSLIQGIQDSAKMGADGIVKSMDKNFTIDTKYYRRRL